MLFYDMAVVTSGFRVCFVRNQFFCLRFSFLSCFSLCLLCTIQCVYLDIAHTSEGQATWYPSRKCTFLNRLDPDYLCLGCDESLDFFLVGFLLLLRKRRCMNDDYATLIT